MPLQTISQNIVFPIIYESYYKENVLHCKEIGKQDSVQVGFICSSWFTHSAIALDESISED